MPAIVTILSPFCIFSWNFLANLAFFACGRIIKSQNTRIIPANKINCKDPPPEGACNKTTNRVIVLLGCLFMRLLLLFFYFHLELQGMILPAFCIRIYRQALMIDAHMPLAVKGS